MLIRTLPIEKRLDRWVGMGASMNFYLGVQLLGHFVSKGILEFEYHH